MSDPLEVAMFLQEWTWVVAVTFDSPETANLKGHEANPFFPGVESFEVGQPMDHDCE